MVFIWSYKDGGMICLMWGCDSWWVVRLSFWVNDQKLKLRPVIFFDFLLIFFSLILVGLFDFCWFFLSCWLIWLLLACLTFFACILVMCDLSIEFVWEVFLVVDVDPSSQSWIWEMRVCFIWLDCDGGCLICERNGVC